MACTASLWLNPKAFCGGCGIGMFKGVDDARSESPALVTSVPFHEGLCVHIIHTCALRLETWGLGFGGHQIAWDSNVSTCAPAHGFPA